MSHTPPVDSQGAKYFLVTNKPDDYGNRITELVYTSEKNAEDYYSHHQMPEEDADIVRKYITFVTETEEKKRGKWERFYGQE